MYLESVIGKEIILSMQIETKLEKLSLANTDPFITITLPLSSNDSIDPYKVLDELITEVKKELKEVSEDCEWTSINKKLNRLKVKLPPEGLYKAVVAFISGDSEEIIPLNMDVEKRVYVGEDFDLNDILNAGDNIDSTKNTEANEEEQEAAAGKTFKGLSFFCKRTY